ncbi:hypothetical protein Ddye_012728, partial [Dipteronia dyeriana]
FVKKWDDMIKLYYCATYVYRVDEFDHEMAELKAIHSKVYDELVQIGIEKFSHAHNPKKRGYYHHNGVGFNPIDFNRFKVDDKWNEAIVDFEQRTCSCRKWDLDEL